MAQSLLWRRRRREPVAHSGVGVGVAGRRDDARRCRGEFGIDRGRVRARASKSSRQRACTPASPPSTPTAPVSRPRSLPVRSDSRGRSARRGRVSAGPARARTRVRNASWAGPSSSNRLSPRSAMTIACQTACSRFVSESLEELEHLACARVGPRPSPPRRRRRGCTARAWSAVRERLASRRRRKVSSYSTR